MIANGPLTGAASGLAGYTNAVGGDCAGLLDLNAVANRSDPNAFNTWGNDVADFGTEVLRLPAGRRIRAPSICPRSSGSVPHTVVKRDNPAPRRLVRRIDQLRGDHTIAHQSRGHLDSRPAGADQAEISYQETLYPHILDSTDFTNTACTSDAGATDN